MRRVVFVEPGDPPVLAVRALDDSAPLDGIDRLRYRLEQEAGADFDTLRFATIAPPSSGSDVKRSVSKSAPASCSNR